MLSGIRDMRHYALFCTVIVLAPSTSAQELCISAELSDEARQQCERGRTDARRDLESGSPEWHWFGIPDIVTPVADSLLQERYGLRSVFHGDVVFNNEDHYADAYNAVVHDRLASRFGDDFIKRAYMEAEALFPGQDVLNPEVLRDVPAPPGSCVGDERCIVFVAFEINPSGEPTYPRVVRSPDGALNGLALAAAALVRFQPAADAENGRSRGRYTVPVRFARQ